MGRGLKAGLCSHVRGPGPASFSLSFLICETGPTALLTVEALRIGRGRELPPCGALGGQQENKAPFRQGLHCLLDSINVGTSKGHLQVPSEAEGESLPPPVATAEEESSSLYSPLFFFSNYLSRNVWNHERASHTGEVVLTQGLLPQVLSSGASLTTLSQPRRNWVFKAMLGKLC